MMPEPTADEAQEDKPREAAEGVVDSLAVRRLTFYLEERLVEGAAKISQVT